MNHDLLASIDLGTNTARLLIGSCHKGKIRRQHISRQITRLGGGFSRESGISAEAAQRSIEAMKLFAADLEKFGIKEYRAVATSAVRDAVNSGQFCEMVRDLSGIDLEVISGEEEGRLTLQGVLSGLDVLAESTVIFDVGGGSTEYTIASGSEMLFTSSLPLGVVRLTEGKRTVAAMLDKIERELDSLLADLDDRNLISRLHGATLVATAGTATTLAAIDIGLIDYDYSKVNNHLMSNDAIREIYNRLIALTAEQRLQIAGMEPGREDLIIAGSLLTMKSMEKLGIHQIKVSDFGLLEGALLSLTNCCRY